MRCQQCKRHFAGLPCRRSRSSHHCRIDEATRLCPRDADCAEQSEAFEPGERGFMFIFAKSFPPWQTSCRFASVQRGIVFAPPALDFNFVL